GSYGETVLARRISAGGALGPVVTVGTVTCGCRRDPHARVAIAGNGVATIMWGYGKVLARTFAPDGALGPVRTITPVAIELADTAAVDPAGDAVFAWTRQNPAGD